MLTIRRLRWDRASLAQVAGHRVTPDEVEEVCHADPLALQSGRDRLVLIGQTSGGRDLTVLLSPLTPDVCEVVTARPATRRERRLDATTLDGQHVVGDGALATRPSRVPDFAGRAEEAVWWDAHDAADYLMELRPVAVRFARQLSPGLTIHLSPDDLTALRSRAAAEGRTATSLVRDWIQERLDRLKEAEPPHKRRS